MDDEKARIKKEKERMVGGGQRKAKENDDEEHTQRSLDINGNGIAHKVVVVSSLASSNSSESTSFLRWSFAPALQAFSDTHQKLGSGTACFQKRLFRSRKIVSATGKIPVGWMRCFSHKSETALPSTRCSRRIATFCSGLKKRRLISFIEARSFRPRVV